MSQISDEASFSPSAPLLQLDPRLNALFDYSEALLDWNLVGLATRSRHRLFCFALEQLTIDNDSPPTARTELLESKIPEGRSEFYSVFLCTSVSSMAKESFAKRMSTVRSLSTSRPHDKDSIHFTLEYFTNDGEQSKILKLPITDVRRIRIKQTTVEMELFGGASIFHCFYTQPEAFQVGTLLQRFLRIALRGYLKEDLFREQDTESDHEPSISSSFTKLSTSVKVHDEGRSTVQAFWIVFHRGTLKKLKLKFDKDKFKFTVRPGEEVWVVLAAFRVLLFSSSTSKIPIHVYSLKNATFQHSSSKPDDRIEYPEDTLKVFELQNGLEPVALFEVSHQHILVRWMTALELARDATLLQPNIRDDGGEVALCAFEDQQQDPRLDFVKPLVEQHQFFAFIRGTMRTFDLIGSSELPSLKEWLDLTKLKISARSSVKDIDRCYEVFQDVLDKGSELIKSSLLLCESKSSLEEHISFSFPGFSEERFHLGKFGVVQPWKLLRVAGEHHCYSMSNWENTLNCSNVAQELMQTLPDMDNAFKLGKKKSQQMVLDAVIDQLHDLCVAFYLSKSYKLFYGRAGSFLWTDVLYSKSHPKDNENVLSHMNPFHYFFNPQIHTIRDYLRNPLTESPFGSNGRIVCTQLNWLDMYRLVVLERLKSTEDLEAAISQWFKDNPPTDKRYSVLSRIEGLVRKEHSTIKQFLERLPTHRQLLLHHKLGYS